MQRWVWTSPPSCAISRANVLSVLAAGLLTPTGTRRRLDRSSTRASGRPLRYILTVFHDVLHLRTMDYCTACCCQILQRLRPYYRTVSEWWRKINVFVG